MRLTCLALLACGMPHAQLLSGDGQAGAVTADEIMARVAENQDKAQAARTSWVYDMKVLVRLLRSPGKVAQEETRRYTVAPGETGAERKLVSTTGRIVEGKREIRYTEPGFHHKGVDIDADITKSFADDVMWSKGTNAPMVDLFPLTRQHQRHYTFRLLGEEKYKDYDVYRVAYISRAGDWEHDDDCWQGEALIERNEFQPVLVNSHWECKVPRAVTILLGTNVTQLGAKITWQRVAPDVWFPVACGGELKLKALFLYSRTIAFTGTNSDFRRTDVQSTVTFEKPPDD
jgi:hypothetical protein